MSNDLKLKPGVIEFSGCRLLNETGECILQPPLSQLLITATQTSPNSMCVNLQLNGIQAPELVDSIEISIKIPAGSVTFQQELSSQPNVDQDPTLSMRLEDRSWIESEILRQSHSQW